MNIIFILKENKVDQTQIKTTRKIRDEIKLCLKNSQTILSGIFISLMNLPIFILGALWGGLYLQETKHFSNVLATFIVSLLFIGVIIGSPLFGFLSERAFKNRKTAMRFGAILSLIFISLLIFTNSTNVYFLSTLFLLLGIVSSAQCIGYSVIVERSPMSLAATATSVASMIIMGGGALAKIGFGSILDFYTSQKANFNMTTYSSHAFESAMTILPIGFIFAFIVTFFIQDRAKMKEPSPLIISLMENKIA